MKIICEKAPYMCFKKLLRFLIAFALREPCEHTGYRDYILKVEESKYSKDFSVGELGRSLPRGKKTNQPTTTGGKSLNPLEVQKFRKIFPRKKSRSCKPQKTHLASDQQRERGGRFQLLPSAAQWQ